VAGQLDCGRMTAETIEPQRNPGRYAQLSTPTRTAFFSRSRRSVKRSHESTLVSIAHSTLADN
jgi:hypothetical protein